MTIYKDQLEAVYRLIEKPEKWCAKKGFQHEGAYCLVGAFRMSVRGSAFMTRADDMEEILNADDEFARALGFFNRVNAFTFNDESSHEDVLARLQFAIDRAPERP
jgi:hypothetical protein